jgi:hypothetical protein
MQMGGTYKKSRSKEKDRSQEEECKVSPEFVAGAASSDSGPVPNGATRIVILFYVRYFLYTG